ncbi:cysteine desulfurase family protein [Dermatobacter hominis]|uniref:cysteine desulfurase family protein n=1 Tax=Dermatobacter hominis TaxID=2884263 RepID=UPI001D12FE59|nr:cysteine desulfurase family protein [Dermatobacter hominis]UDY37133.1 cysteine desulfurase [Dermatobacter hominis]
MARRSSRDLDRAATSPLRPEARAAMEPFLSDRYGNPSSAHALGRDAVRAVDEARERLADLLGCAPDEVVLTSGGTESDAHAVTGGVPVRSGRVVCSAVEHPAVLGSVRAIGGSTVAVDATGRVDLDALADELRGTEDDRAVELVSVMAANNEVGAVNDLHAMADVVAAHAPLAALHTDAVQAAPWLDLARIAAPAGLVSVSAHKFGGPKGVGALVVRRGVAIRPLLHGGGQEWDRRSGTTNVAGVVGMAAALDAVARDRAATSERVRALRDRLAAGLCAIDGVTWTAAARGPAGRPEVDHLLPGTLHLLIDDVDSEPLLFLLDRAGVRASASSACASGAARPSHVLAALPGVTLDDRRRGALRLSLGHDATAAQADHALSVVTEAVAHLRAASPTAAGTAAGGR